MSEGGLRVGDQSDGGKSADRINWRVVGLIALAVFAIGSIFAVALYARGAAQAAEAERALLEDQVDRLAAGQGVLASQLAAEEPTASGDSVTREPTSPREPSQASNPVGLTEEERSMSVQLIVGQFSAIGAQEAFGWPVTLAIGNYLDGDVGFSVASDHGDIYHGGFYVDEASATVEARLLLKAPVTVTDPQSGVGGNKVISSAELARMLVSRSADGESWRSTWFWVKLGPNDEILAANVISRD